MTRTVIIGRTDTGRKVHQGFSDGGQALAHAGAITEPIGDFGSDTPAQIEIFHDLAEAGIFPSQLCARCFQAQFRIAYARSLVWLTAPLR